MSLEPVTRTRTARYAFDVNLCLRQSNAGADLDFEVEPMDRLGRAIKDALERRVEELRDEAVKLQEAEDARFAKEEGR